MTERKKLTTKLDTVFSKFIRTRNVNNAGYVSCFTCGKIDKWEKMDCGHFQSRKKLPTRWDEQNCQVQCKACNIFNQGKQYVFGINLDKKYGVGTAERLVIKSNNISKIRTPELRILISYYESKINI